MATRAFNICTVLQSRIGLCDSLRVNMIVGSASWRLRLVFLINLKSFKVKLIENRILKDNRHLFHLTLIIIYLHCVKNHFILQCWVHIPVLTFFVQSLDSHCDTVRTRYNYSYASGYVINIADLRAHKKSWYFILFLPKIFLAQVSSWFELRIQE